MPAEILAAYREIVSHVLYHLIGSYNGLYRDHRNFLFFIPFNAALEMLMAIHQFFKTSKLTIRVACRGAQVSFKGTKPLLTSL